MARPSTSLPFAPRGGKSLAKTPPAARGKVKPLKARPKRPNKRRGGKVKPVALMGDNKRGY